MESADVDARIRSLLTRWSHLWGTPQLPTAKVEFSKRLTRNLGRCLPEQELIRLAACLWESAPQLLNEALCHEAAHLAVFMIHRRGARAHGPEWQQLVRKAGYEPRTRIRVGAGPRNNARAPAIIYEHRCPVCQSVRTARRPERRWRCAKCVSEGLAGLLMIQSRPARPGRSDG